MATIDTVGIVSKPRIEHAAPLVSGIVEFLAARGITVRLDEESAGYAGSPTFVPRADIPDGTQLVIVLGGDGTLLSAARAIGGRDIPLFAVNLGGLGFLTAITVDEVYTQLEHALNGELRIGRRRMLHCELWRGTDLLSSHEALNDAVLSKAEIARMIDLEVNVDEKLMCVYKADGLIVSTPTGSTAYSLSAGGPIVYPSVAAFCITPICPHTLTNRPVILPDESVIEVVNRGEDNTTYMTIDGQVGEIMMKGDRVVCRRSLHSISLIRPPDKLFFDVLREKLKWGSR
ncbi:MAG TPA: NAD(+)/NADH kinase [Bryobacteraceae bacterium]|nr:NAD(+)/NADH kinase [Bryobacteraceae bacterium]